VKKSKELRLGDFGKNRNTLNKVGTSEKQAVIEPRLSDQWFLKMEDLVKPAIQAVLEDGDIKLHKTFDNTLRTWLNNIRDWNISANCGGENKFLLISTEMEEDFWLLRNIEEALVLAKVKTSNVYSLLTLDKMLMH
jgi:valyl-tRNA synthetase